MFIFENEKNKEKKNIEIDIGECLLTVSDNRVAQFVASDAIKN